MPNSENSGTIAVITHVLIAFIVCLSLNLFVLL